MPLAPDPAMLSVLLADAARRRSVLTVACVGLDRSGHVRDALGRDAIRHLAGTLLDALRGQAPGGTVAGRLDETTLVLALPLDGDAARQWARRAASDGSRTLLLRGRDIPVELAVGLATNGPTSTAVQLLDDADAARREAERQGGGVVAHGDALRLRADDRLTHEAELRRALSGHGLGLALQPVVELPERHIVGSEALLRWTTPSAVVIPPTTAIAVAEQSGLIRAVGRWVIHQAAGYVTPGRWVSVNVSPRQLTAQLPDIAGQALAAHGTPARGLRFELTPGPMPEHGPEVLGRLQDLGCRVGLSGFGSSRTSSIAELVHLPLDFVKLDPSLLAGIEGDPRARAAIRAIAGLAASLDLEVIAQGVEHERQAEALVALGVPVQQGNHHARARAEARPARQELSAPV